MWIPPPPLLWLDALRRDPPSGPGQRLPRRRLLPAVRSPRTPRSAPPIKHRRLVEMRPATTCWARNSRRRCKLWLGCRMCVCAGLVAPVWRVPSQSTDAVARCRVLPRTSVTQQTSLCTCFMAQHRLHRGPLRPTRTPRPHRRHSQPVGALQPRPPGCPSPSLPYLRCVASWLSMRRAVRCVHGADDDVRFIV